jgi:hypothetical protein
VFASNSLYSDFLQRIRDQPGRLQWLLDGMIDRPVEQFASGQTEYIFLGLSFRQLQGLTAGLKLRTKLVRALALLFSESEIAILDWLAVFGVRSFVPDALRLPTTRFYFVIKLIRRIACRHLRLSASHVRVWPSIVGFGLDLELSRPQFLFHQHTVDRQARATRHDADNSEAVRH